MSDNIFAGMVENLEFNFHEIASGITASLREMDEEYALLSEKRLELQEQFPCIQEIFDGEVKISMTADEHEGLLQYLSVVSDMENIERLRIYYAGHRDCFAYLKKIGVI